MLRDTLRDLVPHLPACQDQCHGQGVLLTSVGTGPGQYAAGYFVNSHVHIASLLQWTWLTVDLQILQHRYPAKGVDLR